MNKEYKIMESIFNIPEITDNKLKYFVDDEYVGDVNVDQINKIRLNIIKHIIESKDKSILNRFYFIGHKDSNDKMGKEIKITMDHWGNFSDLPWEMNHVRRSMMNIMQIERINHELLYKFDNE